MESTFLNPGKAVSALQLCEGMQVADFGSGSGFFTRAAARLVGHTGRVWAIDAHRELLSRSRSLAAAEGLHNVEILAGDVESREGSHLPEEHADAVIAANILFQGERKERIIEEMWRVLKKNGKAMVIDWKDSFGGLGPHKKNIVTEAEGRALLENGGFTVVATVPAGEYHWGFVARKVVSH